MCESYSVMFDSLWPHGLPGVLCPWNSPGQKTGVGSRSLLQGIFPTQGSIPGLLQVDSLPSKPPGNKYYLCLWYFYSVCSHFFFFFLLYLMACLVSPRSPFSLIILSTFWSSIYFRGTSQPIVMEKSVIKSNNPFPSESMHITDTTTPKALSNKFENKQPFTIFQREKETLHYVYRSNESCCFPVTQSWPTLCNPRECSTPGSSVPLDIHRLI